MAMVLGVDAGGTSTRAAVLSLEGEVMGRGLAGCGNPMAAGARVAFGNLRTAVEQALCVVDRSSIKGGVVGLAGSGLLREPSAMAAFAAVFSDLPVVPRAAGDVVVTFAAGTSAADGTVLVSGTGAIAARIIDRAQGRLADGYGWLLGDEGSGFWLGRAAARVAVRELNAGTPGLLTRLVTGHLLPSSPPVMPRPPGDSATPALSHLPPGDSATPALSDLPPGDSATPALSDLLPGDSAGAAHRDATGPGRVDQVGELVDRIAATVQSRPPLALAELAPLVSRAAADGDPAALSIVEAAAVRLARTASEVREPLDRSPIVLAGSVLTSGGPVQQAVRELLGRRWAAAPITVAKDGAGAAAWLAALDLLGPARAAALHSRFVG
ncbi:N-acetylglucosamine kinase [Nonomuraea dietziae]|uniref:N-acetylglucosamine kinase-like BadF-type ATPase n=1 Tax=Nonomuraea dietziae TaxID=65515 RepID=A0A7W5YRT4_9ACTN|nr:BadF/BadG/BcrA/BcrD ATPase family protein [Nonomuraea dietziae]MBB3731317.1 N-acetylglucosamine kinase-like BadF-type ATPase [Nonomuraea dietziae]